MEVPGRNDPCWCGSGKKYKKCHWQADQQAATERAAQTRARDERLAALGHPSDSEMRRRFEELAGRPAPAGPLPQAARDEIIEMWQQEQLAAQAREVLGGEREQWSEYFEAHPDEWERLADEIGQDPFFDSFELTAQNQKKVRSQLGALPDDGDALQAYVTEAIALSLDESDRRMFHHALLSLLPPLVEEGDLKTAFVVESAADRVLDPSAPLSPFLRDVVLRSLSTGEEAAPAPADDA